MAPIHHTIVYHPVASLLYRLLQVVRKDTEDKEAERRRLSVQLDECERREHTLQQAVSEERAQCKVSVRKV